MPLHIVLNGETRRLPAPEPQTLQDLIATLDLNPAQVAIEQNGSIVRRAEWNRTSVHEGDRLEVVQFVGGGCPVSVSNRRSQLLP